MARYVPYTGDEKECLLASLDRHRDAVLWKCEGLDDEALRRQVLPSGNSILGLVKHLATREYIWFSRTFSRPTELLPLDGGDESADVRVEPGESTADIVAFFGRARAATDQLVAELDLDQVGKSVFGDDVSLRWVLIHMQEDTIRHAGHIDIMREMIDGAVGAHRR
jgi:uncharacterized damage-inducible protein DinB